MDSSSIELFCERIPKAELHAHLNGSISENTMRALYSMKNGSHTTPSWSDVVSELRKNENISSLDQCFQLFNIAHAVTVSPEAVYFATKDVVKEFAEDGVVYLELRTTPRSEDGVMSKEQYIDSVVKAIIEAQNSLESGEKIIVKLLVSVNRHEGRRAAEENINLAIQAYKKYPDVIIGVDLSGNPSSGNFENDFMPHFLHARKAGLKVALHCAEVPNEREIQAMLDFGADRLGHCTCIHPSLRGTETLWNKLLGSKVPVEICLTSNVKCKTVAGYDVHHMKYLLPLEYPLAISTDDKGVFGTSLSKEYEIAAKTFNLQRVDLCRLAGMAMAASFCNADEKLLINQKLSTFQNIECVKLIPE